MANVGSTPKTMRALVAYGKDNYVFETAYPTPECGPDDIIIKTEVTAVSHRPRTSLHRDYISGRRHRYRTLLS